MFTITYAAALLSIVLMGGAVAFSLSQIDRMLARALAFYLFTAAVWIGGNAAADVSYTVPVLTLASGIAFIGGVLNVLAFLVLVDTLIDGRLPSWPRLALYMLPTVGAACFAFSTYSIKDTAFPVGAPAQITPGIIYAISFFTLLAALVYGLVRLIRALRRERYYTRRMQLAYALLGLILTLAGELFFDVLLPLFGELRFYTLGPLTSIFFVLGAGYAITAHRLIDIRLLLRRGVTYSLLVASIIAAYTSLLASVLLFFPIEDGMAVYVSAGLTTIAGILGSPFLLAFLERITDRVLFRGHYEYAEALHRLSELLYEHTDPTDLMRAAETALREILRADWVGITYASDHGIDEPDLDAIADGTLLGVPIRHGTTYIGSIHAGPKRGGGVYTPRDRRLLETFAYQAATAFSRAELYEKTKQHAEELQRTVRERTHELQTAQEQERRTLIELSHNLQTPLAVFQARLDQLKQTSIAADDVRSLEQSLARLSSFIYDLLALAKLDRKSPDTKETLDMSELVAEVAEELEVIAKETTATVTSTVPSALYVTGNAKQLREAILNIASNALKYLDETREQRIAFSLSSSDKELQLTISDTGRGIAAEDLPHIFKRFYRGSEAKQMAAGNGLGLAIAKRIIERHGGTITIESTEGIGTHVCITLPRFLVERPPSPRRTGRGSLSG